MTNVSTMAQSTLVLRDSKPIDDRVTVSVSQTKSLRVTDTATYARAGEHLTGYAGLLREIDAYFKDDIDRAYRLHKSLCAKRTSARASVEAESDRLKREMTTWRLEQERLLREREQKLALEAQCQEQARLTAEAALLEQQGEPALAASVLETAITAPAPVIVLSSNVPKVAGVSMVESYDFRIVNEDLLPRAFMTPDLKKIRGVVGSMKSATRIPGVQVFRDDGVRVRV